MTNTATKWFGILMLAWLAIATAHAAPSLSLGSATTAPGTTATIPVSFTNDSAVATLQFDIQYDATQLGTSAPTAGTIAATGHGLAFSENTGGVRRIVITPPPTNATINSGDIVTIPFTVSTTATIQTNSLVLANVVFSDGNGNSVMPDILSNGAVSVVPPVLDAPANLILYNTINSKGNRTYQISWDAVADATEYRIYRETSSTGPWVTLHTTTSSLNFDDAVGKDKTLYYYVVSAYNAISGESTPSNWIATDGTSGSTGGGNNAPTANAGSDQTVTDTDDNGSETVTLDGSASLDSDGTITAFEWSEGTTILGAGETLNATFAVGAHTVTLVVTDDQNATDSDTLVVTVNPAGGSVIDAPTGLTASSQKRGKKYKVNLNWNDNSPTPISYRVYRSLTSDSGYSQISGDIAGNTTAYTDHQVSTGTTYYYVVTAVSGSESGYSNEVSITP